MTTTKKPDDTTTQDDSLPAPGDVILYEAFNVARHAREDQALVVVGSSSERLVLDNPDDERRETHVHAVPIGWAADLYQVPKTAPVPNVAAGAYAQLRPGAYRLP